MAGKPVAGTPVVVKSRGIAGIDLDQEYNALFALVDRKCPCAAATQMERLANSYRICREVEDKLDGKTHNTSKRADPVAAYRPELEEERHTVVVIDLQNLPERACPSPSPSMRLLRRLFCCCWM